MKELKEKYDREGVEYIQNEEDMALVKQSGDDPKQLSVKKPGPERMEELKRKREDLNRGGKREGEDNPLSIIINSAKKFSE